jgi:hypothetical protein
VAKIQKHIDSAVKNKNSSVLADIFEGRKLREVSGYKMTKDEAISILERDEVWETFGLYSPGNGYLTGHDAEYILDDMKWGKKIPSTRPGTRYDLGPLPWPEALGGG